MATAPSDANPMDRRKMSVSRYARLTPPSGEYLDEVDKLVVPELPGMAARRYLAIFVWDLALGQSLDEPPIVDDEDVLVAAREIQQWHGVERNFRQKRAWIPFATLGRSRRPERLLFA